MALYDYQQELFDKIKSSTEKRNCVQLATGGGKTHIFSELANTYEGNVLILVNRTELLDQTKEHINRECSLITAGTKIIQKSPVTIGMVESVYNRLKKGLIDINSYDLIIVDEIQNLQFVKVFDNYNNRLLGFTATPVIDKKEFYFKCKKCESTYLEAGSCCRKETKEYSKTITLKKWYGEIISGIPIAELIEKGNLVDVHNFVCDTPRLDKLVTDKSGQFTAKSENEVFDTFASLENLVLNYEQHAKGLKTMVFNSNIKTNNDAYNKFLQLGYNVRSYDSKSKENRKEIVEWFRSTPDAILMSVGVFTTGFDVREVQVIIMNKATKSLSLYHQIVGRGGRTTTEIFKPYFKFIDLGGNVNRFFSWSDPVDWEYIYNNEVHKVRTFNDLEDFKTCHSCDAMIMEYECEYCGASAPPPKSKRVEQKLAKEVKKLPPPQAKHILNYAKARGLDINAAKNLVANYIVGMFYSADTKIESVQNNIPLLKQKIEKMVLPIYFELHNSDLEGNRVRKFSNFEQKIYKAINKYYEESNGSENTTGDSSVV